jgi:hypothetical protein
LDEGDGKDARVFWDEDDDHEDAEIMKTILIVIGAAVAGFLVWHLIAVGMQYQAYWNGR